VARYIYQSAPYPSEPIALAGALGFLAAVTGRAFNVSGTGLNVYIAIIGSTAIGKEAAQSGISRLLKAVAIDVPAALDFVGPSYFASGQALHKRLARTPSMLAPIGELGLKLASWGKANGNPSSQLWLALLLDVFGKSGGNQMLQGAEYSDKGNNVPAIHSPCLTLLGDSTPETYYRAHSEEHISNGLVGRIIPFHAGSQQGEFNTSPALEVPADLVDDLKNLCAVCLAAQKPFQVELTAEADVASTRLRNAVSNKINSTENEITRHLYGRVHLNVLKLAAIMAVGRTAVGNLPTICEQDITWASRVVCAGVDITAHKVANDEIGEAGGNQTKQLDDLVRVIRDYLVRSFDDAFIYLKGDEIILADMHKKQVFTISYLQRRLFGLASFKNDKMGATKALERSLKTLKDNDDIRQMPHKQTIENFGINPICFMVSNRHRFVDP
jgi:hypothetical protein